MSQGREFKPENVKANSKLRQLSLDWHPPKIYQVSDCVHVAVGYARCNPVLIVGDGGLIVVDPGESETAAAAVKAAFNEALDNIFDNYPVEAIIYTHYHDCHIHGASVFAGDNSPVVISHEKLPQNLFNPPGAVYSMIFPTKAIRAVKYMGVKFQDNKRYFVNGGIFPFSVQGPSGYLPPTRTVKDCVTTTIAGIELELVPAPGETSDIIYVFIPSHKVLIQIGDFYKSFPAITTLRGASSRNPLDYINSIDGMRKRRAEHLILIHGGEPLSGESTIYKTLTASRDALQFIHDQTLQCMNRGMVPGEIAEVVKLPKRFADNPYAQEYFGEVDRDIFQIFSQYVGWFSGKCRDLFPMSPKEEAAARADLAGGIDSLAQKAETFLDEERWKWAMILADDVLLLLSSPDDTVEKLQTEELRLQALGIKSQAMIRLAEETYNAQTRNYLLSEFLDQTGQLPVSPIGFNQMDDHMAQLMPMESLFGIMAVCLNAEKAIDLFTVGGLRLTDDTEYTMTLRYGILETTAQACGDKAKFIVETESSVWKNVVLGKVSPLEAGVTIVQGSEDDFYSFMDNFYLGFPGSE